MFHSSAGFWEFLSLSGKIPPFPFSFSGFSWFQWAVPMFIDWRSIWYCLSSTSDPGSRSIPRVSALLQCQHKKVALQNKLQHVEQWGFKVKIGLKNVMNKFCLKRKLRKDTKIWKVRCQFWHSQLHLSISLSLQKYSAAFTQWIWMRDIQINTFQSLARSTKVNMWDQSINFSGLSIRSIQTALWESRYFYWIDKGCLIQVFKKNSCITV